MNIRGGSKNRIDIKKEELKEELSKPEKGRNQIKIRRLKASIKRNKDISYHISKKRKKEKEKKNK